MIQNSTNVNTRPVVLTELAVAVRRDNETIKQNAGRTADLLSKTLMGRLSVESAVVATPDGGNTGDGTITASTVIGLNSLGEKIIPKVGNWVFELTAALIGKLTDPDGVDRVTGIAINDGGAQVIVFDGLQFTVNDGGVAFVSGDKFTLAVAVDGDWIPYDPADLLGADKPQGIFDPEGSLGDIPKQDIIDGDVLDIPILIAGAIFDDGQIVFESGAFTDTVGGTGLTVEEFLRGRNLIAANTIAGSQPENA